MMTLKVEILRSENVSFKALDSFASFGNGCISCDGQIDTMVISVLKINYSDANF